jgi:hypothetical protein
MESDEKRINEAKQQIARFYHDNISVEEAVELMRDKDISAEFVERVYDQLSEAAEKSITDRFHYCNIDVKRHPYLYNVNYWTSRYLIDCFNESSDSAFHEITIFDVFNNKSM